MVRTGGSRWLAVLILAAVGAVVGGTISEVTFAQGTPVERIQMANACYVRLPDLPEARYGGFGGYNHETGVLTYAGGAYKLSADNTEAHSALYAIKLDGSMSSWTKIPYNASVGYTSDSLDKGCREMSSVQIDATRALSVFGKDGCDNGAFDSKKKGGDIKELQIGEDATGREVRWRPNSGAQAPLPADLAANNGKLVRNMATWDYKRGRLIVGQGTFDDVFDRESQDELYYATATGAKWKLTEFRPEGTVPSRRLGTCGQYVNIEDPDDPSKNVDGVIVLGGKIGGEGPQLKEVWWFDLTKPNTGKWVDISDRFSNLDDLGARREGACAYDHETKNFYSVMGRADAKVPDGDKRSAGLWRVNLSNLADSDASLTWERLAKDKQTALKGRRLIPNVWDPVNKRFFVIGGRSGDFGAQQDVWALYPDVTGDACTNLDPYAPFAGTEPTEPPTSVPTTPPPGVTDTPTTPPTPVTPTEPPDPEAQACPGLEDKVPAAVIGAALGSPEGVSGWKELCQPSKPPSPYNTLRTHLSLRNPGSPYNPLYNSVVYKCGCP